MLIAVLCPCAALPGQEALDLWSACAVDQTCAVMYGIAQSGTSATAVFAYYARHVPTWWSPACDNTTAEALAVAFPNATVNVSTFRADCLIRAGAPALLGCPYGAVANIDPSTGTVDCTCPIDAECGPPCSDYDVWLIVAVAMGALVAMIAAIRSLARERKTR